MIGEAVGAYTIVSELGRGGMGVVYLAEHRHLGRRAAIKFLMREFSARADLVNRFFTEARAASRVEHDGIVRVFDCDVHPSGNAYIVMEHLEGQNLQAFLAERGRLPPSTAAALLLRVADALAAAHDKGIVHRDLKPENIFLLRNPPGAIKIVDFGIAKLMDSDAGTRTLSGSLVGTPRYMSPEQARGSSDVDARADVYSLGCILFELLSGYPPFTQHTTGELITAHISQPPPPLDPSVPAPLRLLVEGMLAKAPEDRPVLRAETIPLLHAAASQSGQGAPAFDIPVAPAGTVKLPYTMPLPLSPPPSPLPRTAMAPHPPPLVGSDTQSDRRGRWGLKLTVLAGLAVAGLVWKPWRKFAGSWDGVEMGPAVARPEPASEPAPAPLPEPVPAAPAPEPVPSAPAVAADPEPEPPAPASAAERSESSSSKPSSRLATRPRARPAPQAETPRVRKAAAPSPRIVTSTVRAPVVPRVSLNVVPAGALICLPNAGRARLAGGMVELNPDSPRTTFLIYHPGYHVARVSISAVEAGGSRTVNLRPLTEDDLQPPPPCR